MSQSIDKSLCAVIAVLLSVASPVMAARANEDAGPTLHTAAASLPGSILREIDAAGQLTFAQPNDRTVRVDCDEIVSWGAWQPTFAGPAVWLAGGSWIAGEVQFSDSSVKVNPTWASQIEIPLNQIGGILMDAPENPGLRRELIRQMLESEGSRDLVWLTSGQKVSGLLSIEYSALAGVQFLLRNNSQSVALAPEEVRAIVFSPELAAPPKISELRHSIGLSDGSLVCVSDLSTALSKYAESGRLTTSSGTELLPAAEAQFLDMARRLAIGKVNYLSGTPASSVLLSQMQPASYKSSGLSLVNWPLGLNTDVRGRLLSSGRGIQPRGVAMHATSQAAFRITEECKRFIAEVTLSGAPKSESSSRSASPMQLALGSVTCEVLVARSGKLDRLAEVELSTQFGRTATINVDCSGSRLIVLVVREADQGNYGDEVYWNEARLVR